MTGPTTTASAWPPAFSDEFVASASDLFADHNIVIVVGPMGTNRNQLTELLSGADPAPAWWRGDEVDMRPYSAVRRMFPFLRTGPQDSVDDVVERIEVVLRGRVGRPTLALPDADLCDEASIEILTRLADDDAIRLVATMGPVDAEAHPFSRRAARIDLAPLDSVTIARLVAARFGARPHPTVVAMLSARSQGAYRILREITERAWRAGELIVETGVVVIGATTRSVEPADLTLTAEDRPRRLADEHAAADLLRIAALVPRVDADEAVTILGEHAVVAARRANAVHRDGEQLVLSTPTEGEQYRAQMGAPERQRLFDQYGDRLQRTAQDPRSALPLAQWVMSIGRTLDVDLATRAVSEANREGRYSLAIDVAESADPGSPVRARLAIENAYAHLLTGDLEGARDLLSALDPVAVADDDLAEFVYWRRGLLDADDADRVVGAIAADVERTGNTIRLTTLGLAEQMAAVFATADDSIRRGTLTQLMTGRLSPVNQATAHAILAAWSRHSGRSDYAVEVATTAVELVEGAGAASYHRDFVYEQLALAQLSNADFDAVADTLTAYGAPGAAYGNFGRLGMALWGLCEYFRGDLASALACARSCLASIPDNDPLGILGNVQAMTAQILVHAGRPEEAVELLEASHNTSGRRLPNQLDQLLNQACTYDLLGDPDHALDLLADAYESARISGLTLHAIDAAVLSVQIDGPRRLSMLQRVTEGRTDLAGTCRIWKRFGDLMVANDMHGLVALAEELDAAQTPVFAAEVAQFTLDVARRASDMSPQQRDRLTQIAQPMDHRHIER